MTESLSEFLSARIAEDEARAGAVHEEMCESIPRHGYRTFPCDCGVPARVMAECEAKRRIIEWHKSWPVLCERRPTFEQGDYAPDELSSMTMRMSQQIAWLTEQEYRNRFGSEPPTGPVLKLLALPYADHPDYRQEWAV